MAIPTTIRRRHTGDLPSNLPVVLQFMRLLWALVHGLDRTSKRMTGEIGVTGPQRLVLRVVGLFPGLSAGVLASVLHVHPSTLTGVIQRLVAHRLLARADDPRDRRRAVLCLTTRGIRANAIRRGTVEGAIARALDGTSARDRTATKRVLARLAACLEASAAHRSSGPSHARPAGGSPLQRDRAGAHHVTTRNRAARYRREGHGR